MGFKMKGAPYTSGGPRNMQTVLAGKDPAQVPAKRKGAKSYGQEAETQGPLAMDPNYNGEPGVQKEDFKQFSSKGPLAHKEGHPSKKERQEKRASEKLKRQENRATNKAKRQAKRATNKTERVAKRNKKLTNRQEVIKLKGKQALEGGDKNKTASLRKIANNLTRRLNKKRNKIEPTPGYKPQGGMMMKGPKAHKGGHKAKAITVSESRKNFETDQYRKGVGRIKEGGDSRENKISTRTGRDKVVGSAGNKLVRGKRGSSKTVVIEKSVNKLTPKKQITKKIDKKNITKDLKSKGPLATKEERVARRATKKAARVARRKEKGGSRVGNAIRSVGKTVNKVANSKVGKIAVGTYKTVKAAKSGNIKGALLEGKKVATELATKSNKSKGAKMHEGKPHGKTASVDKKKNKKMDRPERRAPRPEPRPERQKMDRPKRNQKQMDKPEPKQKKKKGVEQKQKKKYNSKNSKTNDEKDTAKRGPMGYQID